ncbi:MAG: hypothetical protein K0Q73_4016 [Paenibacillus sp.]|nr:hypothetical protein [Paenibacillus sp.]
MKLYFRDNFFSSGQTEILNESNAKVGEVDLRSAFGSSLDVFDQNSRRLYSGKFPIFSNKWTVTGQSGSDCGMLRHRFAFMSKKYEYEAYGRGTYEITSPAFSRQYEVRGVNDELAVSFEKVSGWFSASAYCLDNHDSTIDSYEWVAVILGMHAIEKRHQNAAT